MPNRKHSFCDLGIRFYQDTLPMSLSAQLSTYSDGNKEYEFAIWDIAKKEHIYKGNLRETIELILLGKLCLENAKLDTEEASVSVAD